MLASESCGYTYKRWRLEPQTQAGWAPSNSSSRERKVSLSKQECKGVAHKHRAGFCAYPCCKMRECGSLCESLGREMDAGSWMNG